MSSKRAPAKTPTKAPPREAITVVEILNADNRAVPIRSFGTLWDADRALVDAFRREPPPERAYQAIGFSVFWGDGESHEGTVDVNRTMAEAAVARGGILRGHLVDTARWWGSDDFVRHFTGRKPGDEIAAQHAWGKDLAWRLAYDLAAQLASAPYAHRRNAEGTP